MKIEVTRTQEVYEVTNIEFDTDRLQKMFERHIKEEYPDVSKTSVEYEYMSIDDYIELILGDHFGLATADEEEFYDEFIEAVNGQAAFDLNQDQAVHIKVISHSH